MLDVADAYEKHYHDVYRFCFSRLHNVFLAEDITSQVWEQAVRDQERYIDMGIPPTWWLLQIASHRIIDYIRQQGRRPTERLDERPRALPDFAPAVNHRVYFDQTIVPHITRLSERQRTVIRLRFLEDQSLQTTAEHLGITAHMVKAIQSRALNNLRLWARP